MSVESMEDRLYMHRNFPDDPLLDLRHLASNDDFVLRRSLRLQEEFNKFEEEEGAVAYAILEQVARKEQLPESIAHLFGVFLRAAYGKHDVGHDADFI